MKSSRLKLIVGALALIWLVFAVSALLVYQRFRNNLLEMQTLNHERLNHIIGQSLNSYFQRIKFIAEYNVATTPSYIPESSIQEDKLRYAPIKRSEAEQLIRRLNIKDILVMRNQSTQPEKREDDSIYTWQVFKGLPEFDAKGNLLAADRRILARQSLRVHPDLHYVFELDSSGNMVFLEPFEIQKNISSFNYDFRDYYKAVVASGQTALSEGYLSHDLEETQIITVATPKYNNQGQIARIFAASISNATLRDRVFKPLREEIALEEETVFHLIDHHGHIIVSSSASTGYKPVRGVDNDQSDEGNLRTFGNLRKIKWRADVFEQGNLWQRKTESWDSASLQPSYMDEYLNKDNAQVLGTLYPLSILSGDVKKWGILIETPIDVVDKGAGELKRILIGSTALLFITLLVLGWLLHQHFERQSARIQTMEKQLKDLSVNVAHDIRSPLTTLQILLTSMDTLPRPFQNILSTAINGLSNIAAELSNSSVQQRENLAVIKNSEVRLRRELVPSLIASIVSRKRLEYRDRIGLIIDFRMDDKAYGLFCRVEGTDFERVISNIINNSAEAIKEQGNIQIAAAGRGNKLEIVISDDGPGIPADIKSKLFNHGATFGKPGGQGLGLYLAKRTMESLGGSIEISSPDEGGTRVLLSLPLTKPPGWFCKQIILHANSEIIVVDDDSSIHRVWDERLATLRASNPGLTVTHLSSPEELIESGLAGGSTKNQLYLVDFKFRLSQYDGLSLIEKLRLADNAILVTSYDEDVEVRTRAARLGVTILPKSMATIVPIQGPLPLREQDDETCTDR
jgi:signal transduction histidine kinase/CheY-like chemotaxis protein